MLFTFSVICFVGLCFWISKLAYISSTFCLFYQFWLDELLYDDFDIYEFCALLVWNASILGLLVFLYIFILRWFWVVLVFSYESEFATDVYVSLDALDKTEARFWYCYLDFWCTIFLVYFELLLTLTWCFLLSSGSLISSWYFSFELIIGLKSLLSFFTTWFGSYAIYFFLLLWL